MIEFVLKRTYPEIYPKFEKSGFVLANKATVSVRLKIMQLDPWIGMFSAKYCQLSGPIKWI